MKIWVATLIDSPPHAAYASVEMAEMYEKRRHSESYEKGAIDIRELEVQNFILEFAQPHSEAGHNPLWCGGDAHGGASLDDPCWPCIRWLHEFAMKVYANEPKL